MQPHKKRDGLGFCFGFVVFSGLFITFYSSFFYPLLSDCLEMFFSFHHPKGLPGGFNWLHLLNHDPLEKMRYQPLSHLFYYVLHLLFGANFLFYRIVNFLFYFINIILLYRFAAHFSKNKVLNMLLVTLFAFLFSHSGVVLWAHHIYIIACLTAFLGGFLLYIKFLNSSRLIFLYLMGLCFLFGMWCYETVVLWPFAIIILSSIRGLRPENNTKRKHIALNNFLILVAIYTIYLAFYIFTRSLHTYDNPYYQLAVFLRARNFISSGFLVFFNIGYNNVIINLIPVLAFPLKFLENVYLFGHIIEYISRGNAMPIYLIACFSGISLISLLVFFCRKKFFEELKIICFFLFLLVSELYLLFFCRIVSSNYIDSLTEFRYQYFPNAFIILIAIVLLNKFIRIEKGRKFFLVFIITLVFVLNIYCIRKVMNTSNQQLSGLQTLLRNIKTGIGNGNINEMNKVYIQEDLPEYLPHLCWNIEMGERFIKKGNYQWMFSKKEISYFAENIGEATWIIDYDDFSVIKKSPKTLFIKARKISFGKDTQYVNLGNLYIKQGRVKEAEAMFRKAIDLNPANPAAYNGLGACYKSLKEYSEAEVIFKGAIRLDPGYVNTYCNLGHLYNEEGRFKEAEAMFKKAIELDPVNYSAYHGLGVYYKKLKEYSKAEAMLKKAMGLVPVNNTVYIDLGHLYNEERRFKEAEAMFKEAIDLNPANPSAYGGLGACYKSLKEYPKAEAMLKKAIELASVNNTVYIDLGHLYNEELRLQEAEVVFKKAIGLDPLQSEAYIGLGACYRKQERWGEAEDMLLRSLKLRPDNAVAYVNLGHLYNEQDHIEQARKMFQRALALDPGNKDASIALQKSYLNE